MTVYIFDTNVFRSLGYYYPNRFPTIWKRINELSEIGLIRSVREAQREIELNCPFKHILDWVSEHHSIFMKPSDEELKIVAEIFKKNQFRGLIRKSNILKGLPVADPFIVAAAKVYCACVITQESLKAGGARIPTLCNELDIDCNDLEGFLELENLEY
jgi:hypothetical protein